MSASSKVLIGFASRFHLGVGTTSESESSVILTGFSFALKDAFEYFLLFSTVFFASAECIFRIGGLSNEWPSDYNELISSSLPSMRILNCLLY